MPKKISLLRTGHEKNILKAVKSIKEKAIEEAKLSIKSLERTKTITEERKAYYAGKKRATSRELRQVRKMNTAFGMNTTAQVMSSLSIPILSIPKISAIVGTLSGSDTEITNGDKIAKGVQYAKDGVSMLAAGESHMASILGIRAGHDNRYDDFQFQAKQAAKEIEQLKVQIQSAEIRQAMAEAELDNHVLQMENNQEIAEIMKDKFSNQKLYSWMVKEISSIYFKAYQMAFDMAKKAEKAYHFEVGYEDNKQYIQFGHWDSLKKGLLAGERLQLDLRKLDNAYTDRHKRKNELSKQVSLAMLDPIALKQLQDSGKCDFKIPELLFDLDHPGHYMRRIKAVTVSVPAVTGPYTGVTGKLTLLSNRFRKNTSESNAYAYKGINDGRFHHNVTGIQSIATSSGVNDSGMFEMNFNDARFLPFEGAGAISDWRFELPFDGEDGAFRKFDYKTISDLVITIHYTSKDGGDTFKTTAENYIKSSINKWLDETASSALGLNKVISMKHEFPTELYHLLNTKFVSGTHTTTLPIDKKHYPYIFKDVNLQTAKISMKIVSKETMNSDVRVEGFKLKLGTTGNSTAATLTAADAIVNYTFGNLNPAQKVAITLNSSATTGATNPVDNTPGKLGNLYDATKEMMKSDLIEDIILIINYSKPA